MKIFNQQAAPSILSPLISLLTFILMFGVGESILRLKNRNMNNYDIEMWRYARELKRLSTDPEIGHEHIPGSHAILQKVDISINERGLRAKPIRARDHNIRRIVFLGDSIAFGWGVEERDTVEKRLEALFKEKHQDVEVLNAGIGNYNTSRSVSFFLKRLTDLDPSDIVLEYFPRSAEKLKSDEGNFLLRHSELAVTGWIAFQHLWGAAREGSLGSHYREVYNPNQAGFLEMKQSLRKLADYARSKNIRIYLAMMPDLHQLDSYPLSYIHQLMREIAVEDGYRYIDLLPQFVGKKPSEVWVMPNDAHPNRFGHQLMAEGIFPLLNN